MAEFELNDLISQSGIDYTGPRFSERMQNSNEDKDSIPSLWTIQKKGGVLGKPYLMELKLSHDGETYTFPNEPMVTLNRKKTIVETPTIGEGRRGKIKEYITTEDYEITIKGVMYTDQEETYPAEEMEKLLKVMDINDALSVESNPFFSLFGIGKIVVRELKFDDDMEGQIQAQTYEIRAVSDQDFYADLAEQKKALEDSQLNQ